MTQQLLSNIAFWFSEVDVLAGFLAPRKSWTQWTQWATAGNWVLNAFQSVQLEFQQDLNHCDSIRLQRPSGEQPKLKMSSFRLGNTKTLNSFQHQQELINYVSPLQAHRILEEPNMDSEVRLLQLAAHVTAGVADLFAIQWSDAEMGGKTSRVSNRWQMHATSLMISFVASDPKKNILC